MATLNQLMVIGHIGKDDPVLAVTPNAAKPYAKFSLAVDQDKDQTMWLNVTCWDKLAEFVEKYARKGMQVYVQGKLKQTKYRDKQHGIDRIVYEVIATNVQILEKRQKVVDELPDEVLPPE